MIEQVFRLAHLYDFTQVHHYHAIRDISNDTQVMGNKQHRKVQRILKFNQQIVTSLFQRFRVEYNNWH